MSETPYDREASSSVSFQFKVVVLKHNPPQKWLIHVLSLLQLNRSETRSWCRTCSRKIPRTTLWSWQTRKNPSQVTFDIVNAYYSITSHLTHSRKVDAPTRPLEKRQSNNGCVGASIGFRCFAVSKLWISPRQSHACIPQILLKSPR